MSKLDPVQMNIDGVTQLVGSKMNKVGQNGYGEEGFENELIDQFTLKLDDQELLALATKWENDYRTYEAGIKLRQDANEKYYLGKQQQGTSVVGDVPIAANLIFEAEETFLPAALAKNPEPVVWTDNTTEGTAISNGVKTMLQYHADTLVLRRKLTLLTRHWSIYFLGAIKHGWDSDIEDIQSDVINPQCLILEENATIDSYGDYDGEYIGERKECTAERLIDLFPAKASQIRIKVGGHLGTKVKYTEWWSDKYCFYTFKGIVLDKSKNPHFNYDSEEVDTDEDGVEIKSTKKGINHFARPRKPYTFLSVFSLGKHPHDDTGLIEQNIPNQNRISKRETQIDLNLDRSNNSIGLSEQNFNQETAKQAAVAMQKGNPVLIPTGGPISEAIARFPAPAVPDAFFKAAEVDKQDLRSIFGTQGISSQKPNDDTTARGMILNQSFDNTRIGGGIGDALEQVADNIFNWWLQLYCVYYDEPHFAAVMGQMKAVEYVTLRQQDLNRHIVVSVTADSMKPKDEITEMNQAISLAEKGFLDPKTLLTIMNVPDVQKTAESTVLWLLDKNSYLQINFPELAAKLAQQQAAASPQGLGAPPGSDGGLGAPPVQGGSPIAGAENISQDPASAALQNVPLPT